MFTVDDGGGTCMTMSSEGRNCIVATYHRFRLNAYGMEVEVHANMPI